jgi:hypothetical protein
MFCCNRRKRIPYHECFCANYHREKNPIKDGINRYVSHLHSSGGSCYQIPNFSSYASARTPSCCAMTPRKKETSLAPNWNPPPPPPPNLNQVNGMNAPKKDIGKERILSLIVENAETPTKWWRDVLQEALNYLDVRNLSNGPIWLSVCQAIEKIDNLEFGEDYNESKKQIFYEVFYLLRDNT